MFVITLLTVVVGGCQSTIADQQFNYQVRVRDAENGTALTNVSVMLEIQASNLTPLVERTDSLGLARIPVVNGYVGRPGRLVVELDGYETYTRFLDLRVGQLPENVFLERLPMVSEVSNRATATAVSTATPTAVSMPPPASPTAVSTATPTHTATPLPTETATPTPSATHTFTPTPTHTFTPTPTPAGLFVVETTAYIKAYASAQAVEAQAVGALAPGTELNILRTEPGYGGAEWYAFRLAPGLIAWVDACFTEPLSFDPEYEPRPCDVTP